MLGRAWRPFVRACGRTEFPPLKDYVGVEYVNFGRGAPATFGDSGIEAKMLRASASSDREVGWKGGSGQCPLASLFGRARAPPHARLRSSEKSFDVGAEQIASPHARRRQDLNIFEVRHADHIRISSPTHSFKIDR